MCDVEGIVELCRERGIAVVEDCAQAAGAQRGGRRAGSFGDAAAFSFYPTKNLAAIGDGGAVVDRTIRQSTSACARCASTAGRRSTAPRSPGGCNSRLDELQAAVLRVGLAASRRAQRATAGDRQALRGGAARPRRPLRLARRRGLRRPPGRDPRGGPRPTGRRAGRRRHRHRRPLPHGRLRAAGVAHATCACRSRIMPSLMCSLSPASPN